MKHCKPTPPTQQRGITLIESLIALIVAALGILGIVGVQMRTLTDTTTSVRRAQAIRLIEDLGERMRANPNALVAIDSYQSDFADKPTPDDCSSGCDQEAQATYDVAMWKQNVSNLLPLGQASIFWAPGEGNAANDPNRRQLGVMIGWRENERDDSDDYRNDIDATKVRDDDGVLSAGTDAANACPDGLTCHLQYLPVAARCAPYPTGGAPLYYCPGL